MKCLIRIADEYRSYKIRTPFIGCELAGGLWRIVENMFIKLSDVSGLDITVYMGDSENDIFRKSKTEIINETTG
mgnify:CR=1 FL=1